MPPPFLLRASASPRDTPPGHLGFGVGLLIAEKFDQASRHRTAVALIGAGAATILPFVAGIIASINNRPDSSRRIRKQLASIREGTGLSNGHDAF